MDNGIFMSFYRLHTSKEYILFVIDSLLLQKLI